MRRRLNERRPDERVGREAHEETTSVNSYARSHFAGYVVDDGAEPVAQRIMDDEQAPIEVGLRQSATTALASYLNDHHGFLSFNAYLWKTIVIAQYGRGGPPKDSAQLPPGPNVVDEMDEHTQFLGQMLFCRGVDSFLVYLSDLLMLIFTAEPNILKSNEKVSIEFVLDHLRSGDLLSAIVVKKVTELSYQGMEDLYRFFDEKLKLPLCTNPDDFKRVALFNDIRNIITHNRGTVNEIFKQKQPDHPAQLGAQITFKDHSEVGELIGSLVYLARHLDARAATKFKLPTILPDQPPQA